MKYTMEITVSGYGDRHYFRKIADEMMKNLHGNVTSAGEGGAASVTIVKRKIIGREGVYER